MALLDQGRNGTSESVARSGQASTLTRLRLAGEIFDGRFRTDEPVPLREIAAKYHLDEHSVLKILSELQTLGMVSLSGNGSAVFHSPDPKEMQQAYEIRAVLEEVAGRAAARVLKGNTGALRREMDAMRAALDRTDLSSFTQHDVAFHRNILQAAQNEVLLGVWDSLAFDLRIRAAMGKVSGGFSELVDSHQSIVDALEKGRGREAGLLLRNHVETISEFLKKSEADSGFIRVLRDDLEDAEEVHKAFLPHENLSIPGLACETFYKPARRIGGDYYDFFPLQNGAWGIAIGDVCGKGIGAALLMASLQASLRAQAMHTHSDLSTLIADVDRLVLAASPKHLYASLFYAEYNAATRWLRYVNAGHNSPMVLRWKGSQCELFHFESTGTALGLLESSQFVSKTFQLEKGDLFVAYTDGITEWDNPCGELWGRERLETLLRACLGCSPAQIVRRVVDEVTAFAKDRSQRDDMTLMVVGVDDRRA